MTHATTGKKNKRECARDSHTPMTTTSPPDASGSWQDIHGTQIPDWGGRAWPENAQHRCHNTCRWLLFNNVVAELERVHPIQKKRSPTEFLHQDRWRAGEVRRRVGRRKKAVHKASGVDDKRPQASRMRLGSDNIPRIDEEKPEKLTQFDKTMHDRMLKETPKVKLTAPIVVHLAWTRWQ